MGTECGGDDTWPDYPSVGTMARVYLTEIINKAGCPDAIKNMARKCRKPSDHGQHCATVDDLEFRLQTVIDAHTKVMNEEYATQAQIDSVLDDLNHEGGGHGLAAQQLPSVKPGKPKPGKPKGGKGKPKPKPTGKPKAKPKGKGKNK